MSEMEAAGAEGRAATGRMTTKKKAIWSAVAAVLAAAVLVGGYFILHKETKADRILVAVRTVDSDGVPGAWWGDKGKVSARLADLMGKHLTELGLTPVESGNPDVLSLLSDVKDDEDLLDAARSLGAGFTLAGDWVNTGTRKVTGSPYSDYAYELRLRLVDNDSGEEVALPGFPLTGAITGETLEEALLNSVEFVAKRVASILGATLAECPRLAAFDKETKQISMTRAALAAKLVPLFTAQRFRKSALGRYEVAWKEHRDEWERQDLAPLPKTPLGKFEDEEYFLGALANNLVLFDKPRTLETLAGDSGWVYVEARSGWFWPMRTGEPTSFV